MGIRRKLEKLKYFRLRQKYKAHAFHQSFSWDWRAINFNRIAVVNLLLSQKDNPSYLEIGCAGNDLFDSVPARHKVGVDPARGGTVRTTSDAFFLTNKEKFDVIFIDGLHTYEQARRDVINAIACLNPGGWVALHDMLPRNWIEHHVPVITRGAWTGDVWKVAFELAQTPGIDFKIAKIDHGVGVFRLTKDKPELANLTKELTPQQFEYFHKNFSKLPAVEWQECQEWLRNG